MKHLHLASALALASFTQPYNILTHRCITSSNSPNKRKKRLAKIAEASRRRNRKVKHGKT